MKDRTERVTLPAKQGTMGPEALTSQKEVVISKLSPSEEATYQALAPLEEKIEQEVMGEEDQHMVDKLEDVVRERIARRVLARSHTEKNLSEIEQEEREHVFGEALKAVAKVDPASVADYEKILAPIRATTTDVQSGNPVVIKAGEETHKEQPIKTEGAGGVPPKPPQDIEGEPLPEEPEGEKNSFVGKKIQWSIDGVNQFKKGMKVTHLSPDGQYAFVEGSHTGIPVAQIKELLDTEPPVGETNEALEPKRYVIQKIAEGGVPITGEEKIVSFFDSPEIGRQLRYLDVNGKQGKTTAVISVRINTKDGGTIVETKNSTYLVSEESAPDTEEISFPNDIDPKDIFDPKVFFEEQNLIKRSTQEFDDGKTPRADKRDRAYVDVSNEDLTRVSTNEWFYRKVNTELPSKPTSDTPKDSFPKNIDQEKIVDPRVFSTKETSPAGEVVAPKEETPTEKPISTEKDQEQKESHGWETYTDALRAFEEKYGDKKDRGDAIERITSPAVPEKTEVISPTPIATPEVIPPKKGFFATLKESLSTKKSVPPKAAPALSPEKVSETEVPQEKIAETTNNPESVKRSAEELGARLEEIKAEIEKEAKEAGFGDQMKNVDAWYKGQPAWQKYTVGAAIVTIAIGIGMGAVAGMPAVILGGAAGSMGVARRVLTGIGTSILVDELLAKHYRKRGIPRNERTQWFHKVLAIGSGALVGGGVIGDALGNMGVKSDLLDRTIGNPKAPAASLSTTSLSLLEKDPDMLAHTGELDTLSTNMSEGAELAQSHVHTVVAGDSVWKLLEKEIPGNREGYRHYMIDAIIKDNLGKLSPDEIRAMGIGSGDINKIAVGEKIDFSKIFANKGLLDQIGADAGKLTEEQLKNIENYKEPTPSATPLSETPASSVPTPEPSSSATIPVEEFPDEKNPAPEIKQPTNESSSVPVEEWPDGKETPTPSREEVVATQGARDPNLAPEKVRTWAPEVMNKYLDASYNQKYQAWITQVGEREANKLMYAAGVKGINTMLDSFAQNIQPETFSFFPNDNPTEKIRAVKTAWANILFQQAGAYKDHFFGQAVGQDKAVNVLYKGIGSLAQQVGETPRPGETIESFTGRIALKLEIKKALLTP